jgi:hypothetical protein
MSREVAIRIRDLSILLANEHNLFDLAAELTNIVKDVFAELPDFAELMEKDVESLQDLTEQQKLNEAISPMISLCVATTESNERDPKLADSNGQKLLREAQVILVEMRKDGLSEEQIIAAKNYLAVALMQCAIAFGNSTDKWAPCLILLESAKSFASNPAAIERINENLETVRKNERVFGGLEPVKSAPTLSTMNGFGFTLYGSTDPDPESGSHMATYYFVALFIPIFPIARYRVIQSGNGYRFLGKGPLRKSDKWHLAISIFIILWIIAANQ